MKKIGITSTIPVEVLFAGGFVPVDLNNIFITSPSPVAMVKAAEDEGLPRNLCSWVKGIYSVLIANPDIKDVVAVTEGDCANTLAMLDVLTARGVNVLTFSYPYDRRRDNLDLAIQRLEEALGVKRKETEWWKVRLDRIREKAIEFDRMTWQENRGTGFENHLALISLSDFNQNPDEYEAWLDDLIEKANDRPPTQHRFRIGFCGVPTIYSDFYSFLEDHGARVVFNEMQRQFAMPKGGKDIVEQYLNYTYPYSYSFRLDDIKAQSKKRQIHGSIHYIQSFCHHQIHDRTLRKELNMPVLTLEGDKPGPLLEGSRIRIESFLEMLGMSDYNNIQ